MKKITEPVPLYYPIEIEIKGDSKLSNPFFAEIKGMFEGPGGESIVIPGFYNGAMTWVIRFSPTQIGKWKYTLSSSHINLDHQSGEIECAENENGEVHGALRIQPEYPHHFQYEDGTNYFMMGYEADWLWALGFKDPEIRKVKELIGITKEYGFNGVIMNLYAHDTRWCEGVTSEKDYGPPLFYAWEGTNDNPDHTRLNLTYFQNYDRVMKCLFEEGITVHIFFKVYSKMVNWPRPYSLEDDLCFKYITARYQAFPNVIWDFFEGNILRAG